MEKNVLNWRFDVNTFRLIGRDLITDRITALFELVKNSYDANAENVFVEFYDVSKDAINSKIVIKDDGIGMSLDDIKNKWMVIGTNNKRKETHSPAPYKRRYVGEKGIGRFAVDKLGGKVIIRTKKKGEKSWLEVTLNWEKYENLSTQQNLTLFTDVENTYSYEDAEDWDTHGTELIITRIREPWTEYNLSRLSKELTKIVSPFYPINPPFTIFLYSNEYSKEFNGKDKLVAEAIQFYSHQASVGFYISHNFDISKPSQDFPNSYQEVLRFDKEKGKIYIEKKPINIFGGVSLKLYYFNKEAKKKFNTYYKNDDDTRIDGIKIYRDGIVTTPFAETETNPDKQRDILGIHKRFWSDVFNKVTVREIIGVLDITAEGNPAIKDSTNRQDFIEIEEYKQLKEFIIEQLSVFENIKKYERTQKEIIVQSGLDKAQTQLKEFEKQVKNINKEVEKAITGSKKELLGSLEPVKNLVTPLIEQTKEIEKAYQKGIEQIKEERTEFLRKENMYLSLMSLQMYAVQMAHAVRTKLGSTIDMADFFKRRYPNPKYDEKFKEYASRMIEELRQLKHIVDFMLSYAKAGLTDIVDFNVKKTITDLLQQTYELVFERERIAITIEMQDCIIKGHKQFFQDIFQQLIANSIKALEGEKEKKILCTGYIDNDNYIILFSDNGYGIRKGIEEKIFDLFYTTTAEYGGAGIGLWVVKQMIEALRGTIQVVENEFKPSGATFRIVLPFNKI